MALAPAVPPPAGTVQVTWPSARASRPLPQSGGSAWWRPARGVASAACGALAGLVTAGRRRADAKTGGRVRCRYLRGTSGPPRAADSPVLSERLVNFEFVPQIIAPSTNMLLPDILTPVVVTGALAATAVMAGPDLLPDFGSAPDVMFNIIGVLVGLLTVFRTQQSYDRYWEARSSLGALMAGINDAACASSTLLNTNAKADGAQRIAAKTEVARLMRLYMQEATAFLREASADTKCATMYWRDEEVLRRELQQATLASASDASFHAEPTQEEAKELALVAPRARPITVLKFLRNALQTIVGDEEVAEPLVKGGDSAARLGLLAMEVSPILFGVQSEFNCCSKIATTPFPLAYLRIARVLRFVLCFSAPIFLAQNLGWNAVPMTMFLSFGYHAIDAAAMQLCDPFVGQSSGAVLDGRFVQATCDDIDALLLGPRAKKAAV